MDDTGGVGASKKTVASISSFNELCCLFEKLVNCKIKQKKYELLRKYVSNFREQWKAINGNNSNSGDSFFPMLRLMVPTMDRARGPYGVKEYTLARIYVRILCLPKDGPDASKLLNYRVPKYAGSVAGDFAEVAYFVLKTRCQRSFSNMSIEELNQHLDNIAEYHKNHEPRMIDEELTELIRVMSALEQKWLIRILLKGVKPGLGQTSILNAFHPDARSLFDVRNDLQKVCITLHDPSVRLYEVDVELFSHVTPMLAARSDPAKASLLFQSPGISLKSECKDNSNVINYLYLETKLDGERFQLHMCDKEFKYFSHNGFDYTDTYGKDQSCLGTLTSRLAPLIYKSVKSVILDGEMMVWDSKFNVFKTKGHCFDVKKLKCSETGDDGNVLNKRYQPCFCAFDILFHNGKVLTGTPLNERIPILKSVFRCQEGVISYAPVTKEVRTREQIVEALNKAIDSREEGIMLKEPLSVYKPNDRKGGWYKIKPEYIGEVSDTLDLLILGGYYGEGRGKGIISHFLLGLAIPPSSPGTHPKEFHSLGRVGSGYSFDELAELLAKIDSHWNEVKIGDDAHEKAGIYWTKERPDVWIHPHKSCILKIKATEITKADAFKIGYTLRFPRVEEVRYDKHWYQCMTTTEFTQLKEMASGKLYAKHMREDDVSPSKRPKRILQRGPILGEQFRGIDESSVKRATNILDGKEICILNGNEDYTKPDLEKLVVQNGGTIAQNPGSNTFCAIVGKDMVFRVKNLIRSGNFNIIRISWLLRICNVESGTTVSPFNGSCPWRLEEIIKLSNETSELFKSLYDSYGDSYTEPITLDGLKKIVESMNIEESTSNSISEEMECIDIEIFSGCSPFSVFRSCRGYFDHNGKDLETDFYDPSVVNFFIGKSYFKLHSGIIANEIDESVTHVIVESRNNLYQEAITSSKLDAFKYIKQNNASSSHFLLRFYLAMLQQFSGHPKWLYIFGDKNLSSASINIPSLMERNSVREKKFYLVTLDWIKRSHDEKCRLSELQFHPKSPHLKELEDAS